mgnify:CR=1 FL=1
MTVHRIHPIDHPMLRRKASRIGRITPDIRVFVEDMFETMVANHGVGLAAPQIGRPWRVIVLDADGESVAIINPEIVRRAGSITADEGCLSFPNWFGPVTRHQTVTVKGANADGKEVRYRLRDIAARVVQHEIDHLDGIIFIDRLTDPSLLRFVDPRSPEAQRLHVS